jgi:methanogenic corrinoid protein MtbC1
MESFAGLGSNIAGAGTAGAADYRLTRDRLWGAVADRDEYAAVATVFAALDAGMTAEDVLLEVIAPVQDKVGLEWAAGRINVAQEHAATAISDRVIAALAHHPASKPAVPAGRVIVACVNGEWHALPARLLADVLRLRGWQVDFLGAQVPTLHLVAHVNHHTPDVVALSCSLPTRLPTAHAAITASKASGAVVLAGGAGFGPDGRYARRLGADAWAPDARAAAELLRTDFPASRAASAHPIDDLPHLADHEYAMVSRSATQLVKGTVVQLLDRLPGMRTFSEQKRDRTTEGVVEMVDHLSTALYVDDDELFTSFVTWAADILDARGMPRAALYPALELLAEQLKDFPRCQRILHAAHAELGAKG